MLCRLSTRAAAAARSLVAADVDAVSGIVSLRWADGLARSFHPLWLADSCPSRRHPGTRQKLQSAAELPGTLRVAAALPSADTLNVQWESDLEASSFCAAWLRDHGSENASVDSKVVSSKRHFELKSASAGRGLEVRRIRYDELMRGEEAARWSWLSSLADDGATILEGVPQTVRVAADKTAAGEAGVDGVRAVAELIGPMQPNIYGHVFDVISKGADAINLAYTTEAIGPHVSLVLTRCTSPLLSPPDSSRLLSPLVACPLVASPLSPSTDGSLLL